MHNRYSSRPPPQPNYIEMAQIHNENLRQMGNVIRESLLAKSFQNGQAQPKNQPSHHPKLRLPPQFQHDYEQMSDHPPNMQNYYSRPSPVHRGVPIPQQPQVRYDPPRQSNRISTHPLQNASQEPLQLSAIQNVDPHKDDFELAKFDKAIEFFNKNSYCKKINRKDGSVEYKRFQVFEDNKAFKQYSVGIYLYLEMLRILIWFFAAFSVIALTQMVFNFMGTGLSPYPQSYTLYILKTSLGNNTTNTFTQMMIQTGCDVAICILFGIFLLFWRNKTATILQQVQEDLSILDPQKYAVSIKGIPDNINTEELKEYIDEKFGKVYEVNIVYDFKRKFDDFEKLEQMDTDLKMLEFEAKQGKNRLKAIHKLNNKRNKLKNKLSKMDLKPTAISYIIHFKTIQYKMNFIQALEKFYSVDEFSYNLFKCMCSCSVPRIPLSMKFQGEYFPVLKKRRCGRPQDIRWENLDIEIGEKICRFIIGIFIILVVLAAASLTIAVCSIYISTNNDCSGFDAATTLAQAQASTDLKLVYCYCDKHILSYFSDSGVYNLCQTFSENIFIKTFLQAVAALTSTITNIIIAVLVTSVIGFMKPKTNSDALLTEFVSILIATLINSVTIPLLLNASIFGGRPILFFSWVNFENFHSLQSYSDFERKWYAYVGPFYLNFFLIALITPWLNLIKVSLTQAWKRYRLKQRAGQIIQKTMNKEILSYSFNLPTETATIALYIFFSFLYSAPLPILIVLTFLILGSHYIASKIIICRYSRQISANEQINQKILKYLPYALLLHILFAMWSFTCPEIFTADTFSLIRLPITYFKSQLDRIFDISFLLGFGVLLVVCILIDYVIVRFCGWASASCGLCREAQGVIAREQLYSDRLHAVNILGSYNLLNNPEYKAVIRVVHEIVQTAFNQPKDGDQTRRRLLMNLATVKEQDLGKLLKDKANIMRGMSRSNLHHMSEKDSAANEQKQQI